MAKFRLPDLQTFMDFAVLWLVMVAVLRFAPLPVQIKGFLVPKSA